MKSITLIIIFTLAIFSPVIALDSSVNPNQPGLLPSPQSVSWTDSTLAVTEMKVSLDAKTTISLEKHPLIQAHISSEIESLFKRNHIKKSEEAKILLTLKIGEVKAPHQQSEAYKLVAEPKGVSITANTSKGLLYGIQTLRQLMVRKGGKTTIAVCSITDYPAFKIRGFMHDVGRNFQTVEQLKMQIEILAHYKINVFHWHLTDHFGWRLESKKIPKLQDDLSFGRYIGKFYTQKEFKEVVDYCWARGMIVIPEFDSPGHSEAFRHGVGIKNMKDPKAKEAMGVLIDELCSLVSKERMPYIHIGTDEVRHRDEHVNADYLPALHAAVKRNNREVIGWWKGMVIKGDTEQIQQSWAQFKPLKANRHIDSRSNYVNHLEALDFATRMLFQQPCRCAHGNAQQLGGILAHWPDTRVADEKVTLTNNPVIPAMVAYSEAVWTGVKKDQRQYWACVPPKGTKEFKAFADFENRIAEQRDRFMQGKPFPMVKTHQMAWRLLGPVAAGEVPQLDRGEVKDLYDVDGKPYRWTKTVQGAAIHTRHFFNFSNHIKNHPKGKNIVWANSYIYSPKDQVVDAWIGFNTNSSSDDRSGATVAGQWNRDKNCDIWLNGERIAPPVWKQPGKIGKEIPLVDEVYTSRPPAKITLKKGWNKVLVRSARSWKWVFSFSPIVQDENGVREVPGLKYSATLPKE